MLLSMLYITIYFYVLTIGLLAFQYQIYKTVLLLPISITGYK